MSKPYIYVFSTAYDPFIGGAEISILEVAKRLRSRYSFVVFTARFKRNLARREEKDGIAIVRIGWGGNWDKFFLPILGPFVVCRYAKEFGAPSLYWAVMVSFASGIPYMLNVFSGKKVPIVLTLQEGDPETYLRHGRGGLLGLSWRKALKHAARVTAISRYLADVAGRFGFTGNVELIHNGADIDRFRFKLALDEKNALKRELGIDAWASVVITTSRLVAKNGLDTLISAMPLVHKTKKGAYLLIIGRGPEEERLRRLARSIGVKKEVVFLGELPNRELPRYLAMADVFARPSRSEGMGISFVEALAAGLPIIGTPVGGIADIISDRETGLFVKVDDSQDTADKIILLLRDDKLYASIVAKGSVMTKERFSWESIAEQYGSLFKNTLVPTKRILIATGLFPPEIGGPATYSKLLLDKLPQYGFSVKVFPFREVARFPYGVKHIVYLLRLIRYAWGSDIVYAQDPVSVGFPAALATLLTRKVFILKIVGDRAWEKGVEKYGVKESLDEFLGKRYGVRVAWLRFLQKFTAGRADRVVVPSRYLVGVVAAWGVPPIKITLIYNAFEAPMFSVSKNTMRKELKLSGAVMLSAGRLVPWKGFKTLIEILPALLKKVPDITLIIAGGGPDHRELSRRAAELGLQEHVRLLGELPQNTFFMYLKASDIFLLNTGYEGFSHTLLEAMAAEVPVITTTVGGNTEVILENGENGILVRYNDQNGLKKAVLKLLADPERGRKMAQNAKLSLSRFEKGKMLKSVADLFNNELIGG